MISETEFLTKVIERYTEVNEDPVEKELLKSHSIRELMEILPNVEDKEFLNEAMPILLSLFDDNCVDPFGRCSKDVENLSHTEKLQLNSLLKEIK
ncbi:MAG: hypothetical protein GF317_24775 [Candidatus Lokiarchaeota archaeon]|nr:hypothetical protein [Candidatus Lokiarchaeota archaeon]MBD3202576.1 hypothetical protein [Candidatus Lokiarchaeota archaeon]